MKIKIKSEILYLFSVTLIALAVAVCMRADLGMSMIGAPAYILKIYTGLSMTLCEYIVQFIVFVLFCIVMRKFRVVYFTSFLTGLLYGAILKLFQLIPFFSDNYVGELNIWIRILVLVLAMVLNALSNTLYKNN